MEGYPRIPQILQKPSGTGFEANQSRNYNGHDLGVSESQWRPTEREVLEDYLKAVPLLIINGDDVVLQKQVKELTEKTNNNDYLLKEKLQEKDIELQILQKYEVNILQYIIVDNKEMKQKHRKKKKYCHVYFINTVTLNFKT